MAYQIDRYSNTILATVEDGTVDQTTDLKFIGKNYAGYGEIQNENFLFLLENFAGANQPPRAISGQIWFDTTTSKLKFYDGTKWRATGGSETSSTQPTGLANGDFWWDAATNQLKVYNGEDFTLIGPQVAGLNTTAMVSSTVLDNNGAEKSIVKSTINGVVIAIYSSEDFTLNDANAIIGFSTIKKGINLVNSASGITTSTDRFYGTATSAETLVKTNGTTINADDVVIITPGTPTAFTTQVKTPDAGIAIGTSDDFTLKITAGEAIIGNSNGVNSRIKLVTTNNAGVDTTIAYFNIDGLIPNLDNTYDIGTPSLRWENVYGVNFIGEATKATSLRVGSDFRTAAVSATNNTIAVRDATGNLSANLFNGTATAARYADLAEKYTTDQEYLVGTVMAVGGDAETRAASLSDLAIGVISLAPAYLMNSECQGQAIGLKGRVPVRVSGPVSKGQSVYSWKDGVASTIATTGLVGIALETNHDEGEKLVECVLKV
tara:strand:+ start:7119 stop:8591 length:1473 start_codon:yes stop_codon:yes gene_type:complete